ncbi:hypothetical protein TPHA_0D03840 [Tetrapisispora phaffii CBS 4417]|uniref:Uncharacterized protein n=1 Tax=Tetrapisispora phaffii (strain ATCC 24235 / CBS 4417 / NBRC 1672 / NRRL Y-8282 / UCD 70-5) TaxID=1071381 RepID=G8BT46_TETPH|nr:hypothetical protein TPHA_0D03840 [Tetrapisispora phaffii CBS 4417]CCE63017.1 hypothetical protein TPHA_0D03840 [Tetrapisispora phaffii CBS 4417]
MSTPTPVTGKLTSRVMNMKFMKFANNGEELTDPRGNASGALNNANANHKGRDSAITKKFNEASEWKLERMKINPESSDKSVNTTLTRKIIKIKKTPTVVSNVGVASLQRLRTPETNMLPVMRGRRVIGEPEVTLGKRKADEGNEEPSDSLQKEVDEDSYEPSLDKIFKSSKKVDSKKNKNKKKKNSKKK